MLNLQESPTEKLLPLTRKLVNEFAEKFECSRYAENGETIREALEHELCRYRTIDSYIRVVEKSGLYGVYHDLLNVMLIPAMYEELIPFPSMNEMFDWIAKSNDMYGVVKADGQGTVIYPFVCDMIAPAYEEDTIGPCIYRSENKLGLMEKVGEDIVLVLPAEYDNIEVYPGTPYIQLCRDGKVGLYGAIRFIPPVYDAVYIPLYIGWIKVKYHGQWGYIDPNGDFTENIENAFLYHS